MTKADIFLDLNRKLASGDIYASDYRQAIGQLEQMRMKEETEQPPKFILTWNEQDGLRIENPWKSTHISITVARWLIFAALILAVIFK